MAVDLDHDRFTVKGAADSKHIMDEIQGPDSFGVEIAPEASVEDAVPVNGELQLNVGGRATTQRRLRHYQVIMIGFCSGIGTGLFLGFLSALVDAAFSYIEVETVVITAGEAVNPHRSIPNAAKKVAFRIGFFHVLGAFMVGIIVSPRNKHLVSGSGNASSSPFVIAIRQAGISVLPSIANAGILISAWSAGNSYCWVASRLMVGMTTDDQLPRLPAYLKYYFHQAL